MLLSGKLEAPSIVTLFWTELGSCNGFISYYVVQFLHIIWTMPKMMQIGVNVNEKVYHSLTNLFNTSLAKKFATYHFSADE